MVTVASISPWVSSISSYTDVNAYSSHSEIYKKCTPTSTHLNFLSNRVKG